MWQHRCDMLIIFAMHTDRPIRSENNHLLLIHSYALFTHFFRRLFEYQYERTGIVVLNAISLGINLSVSTLVIVLEHRI